MLQAELTTEQIVKHYRDVTSMLSNLECGPKTRAAMTKKSGQTLKQYGCLPPSLQHRLVPPEDLQKLRDEAAKLHWLLVDRPIADWFLREGYGVGEAIRPKRYCAFGADHISRGTHTFLPRVIELAENNGGYIHHNNGIVLDLDEAVDFVDSPRFRERSRWRRAAYRLRSRGQDEVITEIARAHGYCDHSVGQIATEYERWRVGIKPAALAALEEAAAAQEIA